MSLQNGQSRTLGLAQTPQFPKPDFLRRFLARSRLPARIDQWRPDCLYERSIFQTARLGTAGCAGTISTRTNGLDVPYFAASIGASVRQGVPADSKSMVA